MAVQYRIFQFSALNLCLASLLSCQATPQVTAVSNTPSSLSLPNLETLKQMQEFNGQITVDKNSDGLRFNLKPFQSFQVQEFSPRFNKIQYLRIWVRGQGIADRIWNQEGFTAVNGGSSRLSVSGIPKGKNRIVTAQGYDANKNVIEGATLKAYYSSPPEGSNVTIHLIWRFTSTAKILEDILEQDPEMAGKVDVNSLQATLDQTIYQGKTVGDKSYTLHPALIDTKSLAASLMSNNGNLQAIDKVKTAFGTAEMIVQNPIGNPLGKDIDIFIDDPASNTTKILGGTDRKSITNIPPGTWNATIKHSIYPELSIETQVTVTQDGKVTLLIGGEANPIVFPPLITETSAIPPAGAAPADLAHHWSGENNAFNVLSENFHGTWYEGGGLLQQTTDTHYAVGVEGKAFHLNGSQSILTEASIDQSVTSPGWTAMAWVYPSSTNTDEWVIGTDNGGFDWSIKRAGNKWAVYNGTSLVTSDFDVDLNQWQHVAAVFTPGVGVKFYKNLKEQAFAGIGHDASTSTVAIGGNGSTGGFTGRIDEVKSYSRVLTIDEIRNAANLKRITLKGEGFSPVLTNNGVKLGTEKVTPTQADANTLTLDVPPMAESLTVTIGDKTTKPTKPLAIDFTVGQVSHKFAYPGDIITLSGTGFDPIAANNQVTLGGLTATVTGGTTTSLTIQVPPGFNAPGDLVVTNSLGTKTGPRIKAFYIPNVQGYWSADNNSAINHMGSPHGTTWNGAGYAAGKIGTAFSFNGAIASWPLGGVDAWGNSVKTSIRVPNQSMTFMAWVYPLVPPGALPPRRQVMSTDPNAGYGWSLYSENQRNFTCDWWIPPINCRWNYWGWWGAFNGIGAPWGPAITYNAWQHVAAVFDKTNNQTIVYKNGIGTVVGAVGNVGGALLHIGKNPLSTENFNGQIDEVYLVKAALTPAQILAYYDATK